MLFFGLFVEAQFVRSGRFVVVDVYGGRDSVLVLAQTYRHHDLPRECVIDGNVTRPLRTDTRMLPPGVCPESRFHYVECATPRCWSGDLGFGGITVRVKSMCSSRDDALVFCVAPLRGMINGALLIEWIEYHLALGFDRLHFYVSDTSLRVLDSYSKVVAHDWSATTCGQKRLGWDSTCYCERHWAQYMALYDCYSREWARGHTNWTFFGDIDEMLSVPLAPKSDLKALMATVPAATTWLGRRPWITLFSKTQPVAGTCMLLAQALERATTTRSGALFQARGKYAARVQGFGDIFPMKLEIHHVHQPSTGGWPLAGLSKTALAPIPDPRLFGHNHYMVDPPRKRDMRQSKNKALNTVRFATKPLANVLNIEAVQAATGRITTNLSRDLRDIYDCWRARTQARAYLPGDQRHPWFAVDAGSECAALSS